MSTSLFISRNTGRSQMAEAFLRPPGPADLCAPSQPAILPPREVHPADRRGIAAGGSRPYRRVRRSSRSNPTPCRLAVTLGCSGPCPYVAVRVEESNVPDHAGSRSRWFASSRTTSAAASSSFLVHHAEEIHADRTAHEARLARSPTTGPRRRRPHARHPRLRRCGPRRFADVPIRTFVLALAGAAPRSACAQSCPSTPGPERASPALRCLFRSPAARGPARHRSARGPFRRRRPRAARWHPAP